MQISLKLCILLVIRNDNGEALVLRDIKESKNKVCWEKIVLKHIFNTFYCIISGSLRFCWDKNRGGKCFKDTERVVSS